jgi:hypothetical protein
MLCKGETIGQWRDDVIHQHFRDHDTVERYQGTFGTIPYEFLRYRQKSGGSFGLVDYFLLGDTLTVRGDYGFAVYRAGWTDLGHIANSGYDYFCGKCEASEVGKRFKEWDHSVILWKLDPLYEILKSELPRVIGLGFMPTAEVFAKVIAQEIVEELELLPPQLSPFALKRVTVCETEKARATWTAEGA